MSPATEAVAQFPVEFTGKGEMTGEEAWREVWGPLRGLGMVSPTRGLNLIFEATFDEIDEGVFRVKVLGWADEPLPDSDEADE